MTKNRGGNDGSEKWVGKTLRVSFNLVLWVNIVNTGAVSREWWYIICGRLINFKLEVFFLVFTKYILISSNRSNYTITKHYRFLALLTLSLHSVAHVHSFPQVGRCGISPSRLGETPKKILERCRTTVIPYQFENITLIRFRILKIITSVPPSFT